MTNQSNVEVSPNVRESVKLTPSFRSFRFTSRLIFLAGVKWSCLRINEPPPPPPAFVSGRRSGVFGGGECLDAVPVALVRQTVFLAVPCTPPVPSGGVQRVFVLASIKWLSLAGTCRHTRHLSPNLFFKLSLFWFAEATAGPHERSCWSQFKPSSRVGLPLRMLGDGLSSPTLLSLVLWFHEAVQ